MEQTKSVAPALAAGIKVLGTLNSKGAMNLAKIAHLTKLPPSSLLRILSCLQEHNLVKKEQQNYYAIQKIVPIDEQFVKQEQVNSFLEKLSHHFNATCEWYEYIDNNLKITARYETQNLNVNVVATLGFKRTIPGELDAVVKSAIISDLVSNYTAEHWWVYNDLGEKKLISYDEFIQLTDKQNSKSIDFQYNENGVRRCATPVYDQAGNCISIVALVMSYRPNHNKEWENIYLELKNIVKERGFV